MNLEKAERGIGSYVNGARTWALWGQRQEVIDQARPRMQKCGHVDNWALVTYAGEALQSPEVVTGDSGARKLLQYLAAILDAEGAFDGLSWHDAKHAATAIMADFLGRNDDADFLRARAQRAENGSDHMAWDDPAKTARAFSIAAMLLAL